MKKEPRHISELLNEFLNNLKKKENKRLFGRKSFDTALDWLSVANINSNKTKL